MPVTVKFFGEGLRLWLCEVSTETWEEWKSIRKTNELDWEQLLFNLSFLNKYGFAHWSALSKQKEQLIFLCRVQNIIEIKQSRKLLERFRTIELSGSNTLFPLYKTIQVRQELQAEDDKVAFVLCQVETGTFAKYTLPDEFEIDDLQFYLTNPMELFDNSGVCGLEYKSKQLKSAANDTVVRSSRVFLLEKF